MKVKACGAYGTNCYLLDTGKGWVVIDPGDGAFPFIKENCDKVLAVLNTHGHFDHVYDNSLVKEHFNTQIYIHEDDAFMLEDPFNAGFIKHKADVFVKDKEKFEFGGLSFCFHHFPGHTPGCCMIECKGLMFSGDFLFARSLGRYDFPYSNPEKMLKSLEKAQNIQTNFTLYPGHGGSTTLFEEKANFRYYMEHLKHA